MAILKPLGMEWIDVGTPHPNINCRYGDPYLYTIFFVVLWLWLCLTASFMSLTIINIDAIKE